MTFLKKILLIDADPRAGTAVRTSLERTGRFLVREEHDERCAMKSARWFQPNLILFDVASDGRAPTAAAEEFQKDETFRDVPIVCVRVDQSSKGVVLSSGILSGYSFFANPVPLEQFVGWIGELLAPPARQG